MSESSPQQGFLLSPEETAAYLHIWKVVAAQSSQVTAAEGGPFLIKSRLPSPVLRDIWNLADSEQRGSLTQFQFYRALKLVSLAQAGKPTTSLAYLNQTSPLPMFEGIDIPTISAAMTSSQSVSRVATHSTGNSSLLMGGQPRSISTHSTGNSQQQQHRAASLSSSFSSTAPHTGIAVHHTGGGGIAIHQTGGSRSSASMNPFGITLDEKDRYRAAFASCNPANGIVSGDKARELFIKSNLSVDVLGNIWNLVDTSGIGVLNTEQFMVAMYLIMKMKTGSMTALPSSVPPGLWAAMQSDATSVTSTPASATFLSSVTPSATGTMSFMDSSAFNKSSTSITPLTSTSAISTPFTAEPPSLFSNTTNQNPAFDAYFDSIDTGKTGFISGQDAYAFFLKSRLPETDLARIWDIADKSKSGRLNRDEFHMAMGMIKQHMTGGAASGAAAPPQPQAAAATPPSQPMPDLLDLSASFSSSAKSGKGTSATPLRPTVTGGTTTTTTSTILTSPPSASSAFDASSLSSFPSISSPPPPPPSAAADVGSLNSVSGIEMELKSRKQELKEAEKLFQSLNPAVEQVQAKRAEAEAELKALTDERNQITLKMSQQRALFEAEKQILADTQVVVARERGIVEIARQEVAQAERAVALMTSEKQNIESELANIRQEEEECKRLLRDFSEKKSVLRTQLDQLRGDQSSSAKMLEVNQKLLASAQTEYQQIKMDVQGAESRLEYDKTRTQAISNQIAVQSAINDKERIKMKQLNESIASMATSRDALDANLRNLNAENASMISANNSARSSLAAIPQVGAQSLLLTQDNKNMSGSAFSSNANIAPSSSAANMPLNSSFAANGSVVTPVGGATVSVSPARSAKEEFDSLFDSNAPKSKQNLRRSSSSSFKPEFSGPDKNYPTSVKSLNVLEGSQQQKDRPLSVRSLNLQSSTASSNSPATNGNILDMLAFTTPVAAAGTSDSATSSQANLNNGGATSGSNQQPPPRPPSNAKPSVSGAGSSLSAPPFTRINATIPEANESTPPDQAMKVQATTTPLTASVSNMVLPASMANINIEEEMKRAFTGGGGTNITQTVRSVSPSKMDDAVFQNVSTDFGEDAFKFEASFDTSKSFASRSAATATTAANSTYDIFASAFGGKPAAISSNFASANTSFNNAATNVSFAMAPGSFSVQGVDPFETAFGPTSAKGTAGAAAASSKIDFDAVFGPATGFAPSQPATQQKPVASSSAAVFSFDDAFAASGFDGQQQQQQPRPVSPSKSLNGDLGAEVKQLLSMGFTKEQAVQALEKYDYDLERATNFLLG